MNKTDLEDRISKRSAVVSVIGLGYVGLPLAVEFASAGFRTYGFDVDAGKIDQLRQGRSYIPDVPSHRLRPLVESRRLTATDDFSHLREVDTVSICVPTPLRKTKDPDISYVVTASQKVKEFLHPEMLIVLESTTYPGTTCEVLLPLFEDDTFRCGRDFYLAFSPERIDPGNREFATHNTPKVVGGVTPQCTRVAEDLYSTVVRNVVPVSSPACAEMVKLLENTFRSVNIALVNELALMCNALNIDTWEVIDAAATKPFGFMKFYPGPGLGGHCIPIDPHYLLWKLKSVNSNSRFIELASEINAHMPDFVVTKISDALNGKHKCLNGARILLLGVAYKPNVNDPRESPALEILRILQRKGATVDYHDPYVDHLDMDGPQPQVRLDSISLASRYLSRKSMGTNGVVPHRMDGTTTTASYDCVVVTTNHSVYDFGTLVEDCQLLVDTRNATNGMQSDLASRVVKL